MENNRSIKLKALKFINTEFYRLRDDLINFLRGEIIDEETYFDINLFKAKKPIFIKCKFENNLTKIDYFTTVFILVIEKH